MNFISFEDEKRPISHIHIRLLQRNGKKSLTIVEGLAEDLDLKKIAKAIRKTFSTSCSVLKTEEEIEYLQIGGDHRNNCRDFFIKYKIWEKQDPEIRVHGA